MKSFKNLFAVLGFGILILSGCSFFSRADINSRFFEKSRVNPEEFNSTSLTFFRKYFETDNDTAYAFGIYHGDVQGDSADEIVAVGKHFIKIYSLSGEVLASRKFKGTAFGSCVIADVDEDGKKDIVIGSSEDKGVRILVYSGVLSPVSDFSYSKMYNGKTRVHFVKDSIVYFSAVSSICTPPKITGAYDAKTDSLLWKYYTGPVPLDIAADRDFNMLTISNTPKSKKGFVQDDQTVSDHSKYRSSIYVLGSDGKIKTQLSIGPEYKAGEFQDGGISSVTERFVDSDNDGTDELLVAVNRISDFYRGNAELQLRSLGGEIIRRREFSPDTEIEFSFYNTGKNLVIAALLKQSGEMYLLNGKLETIKKTEIPDFEIEGTLQECGDYNGDGKMEYLVTAGRLLYLLDSSLNPVFNTAAGTLIKNAFIVSDSAEKPVLAVLSDNLSLYRVGNEASASVSFFSDPPGADLYMNGNLLKSAPVSGLVRDIPPGKVSFQVKMGAFSSPVKTVNLKGGEHYIVDLELRDYVDEKNVSCKQAKEIDLFPAPVVPLSDWRDIHLIKEIPKKKTEILIRNSHRDLAGDSGKDFMFFDREEHTFKTVDSNMSLLCEFRLPADYYVANTGGMWPDIDGNGKADIVVLKKRSSELLIFASDGKLLGYKRIGRFPDTVMGKYLVDKSGRMMIDFATGYVQQPRGIMGIDTTLMKINFFYPIAANPIGLLRTGNGIILSDIHTPSNGCEIVYSDGAIARDSEYFIYAMDGEGNPVPGSFNPKLENNNGQLFYYTADLDKDGKEEVYLVANKTNYYTGRTEVMRFDARNMTLSEPLFSPGEDLKIFFKALVLDNGRQLLAAYRSKPGTLLFLDSDFNVNKQYNMEEKGFPSIWNWLFPDLDSDGSSEMFLWNKTGLYIFDINFNPVASIGNDREGTSLNNVIVSDLNSDGKDEIVLVFDNTISIYSY